MDTGSGIAFTGFAITRIGSQNETIFAIKEILRHAGFKTKQCITAVSGRSVIVRYVNMNQMPMEELRQAIKFEADKYIPFEVDEVVMDCQILEENVGKGEGDRRPDKESPSGDQAEDAGLDQQLGVAGEPADAGEAPGQRDDPVSADRCQRGPYAVHAAVARGNPRRSGRVGAECEVDDACGNSGSRPR